MHLLQHTTQPRRPCRWPKASGLLLSSISLHLILLIIVSGSEAIVKQQPQQPQQTQQQQQVQPQQQSRSDEAQPVVSGNSHQSAYNNHQSSSAASQAMNSGQVSALSSPSQLSYSSGQQVSQGVQQQQSQANSYVPAGSYVSGVPAKSSSVYDGLASNNQDQSYQAAAQSVNMALANSGFFGASNGASAVSGSQSGQALNPLHYFYYPSKDSGNMAAQSQQQQQASQQPKDALNSAASSYQSMTGAFPSYTDQLGAAMGSPDVAASSQDPSYLPQPAVGSTADQQMYQSQQQQQQQQQHQQSQPQQHVQAGQQASQQTPGMQVQSSGIAQHPSAADLGVFSGGQQQASPSAGSVSFGGPAVSSADYLNPHLGSGQQQGGYQPSSSLYGDLSTSNFGSNAGNLASVASYLSPQQQQSQHQSQDLFASLAGGQQFSSAASQLSPAAVSPPVSGPQASPLFNPVGSGASALFGAGQPTSANSLFANQHYLNSFLTPQQYQQLTGNSAEQALSASASSPSASVVSGSGSGKRFGIGSFIMPMLALAGLSLLIPTMSNIGTAVGRKKRSVPENKLQEEEIVYEPFNGAQQVAKELSIGEYMDKIDRYYTLYKSALENDHCLDKLVCELGLAAKDIAGKSAVFSVIEKLVPSWMTGKMQVFKKAMHGHKKGREICEKFVCSINLKQH